jgi:hypothetical protein
LFYKAHDEATIYVKGRRVIYQFTHSSLCSNQEWKEL